MIKYSNSQLDINPTPIGAGSFGEVFKEDLQAGKNYLCGGHKFAIKKIIADNINPNHRDEVIQELNTVAPLSHPNIVRCYGYVDEPIPWIVFELVDGGSLLDMVSNNNVPEINLVKYCKDVCDGMTYLHQKQIVHRDLAARNILIQGIKIAKVSDFGLARVAKRPLVPPLVSPFLSCSPRHVIRKSDVVELYNAPPECYGQSPHFSFASDVWAFGVVMHEMWNGGLIVLDLNKNLTTNSIHANIKNGKSLLDLQTVECEQHILNVMQEIFKHEKKMRPKFSDLSDAFFSYLKLDYSRVCAAGLQKKLRYLQQVHPSISFQLPFENINEVPKLTIKFNGDPFMDWMANQWSSTDVVVLK